MSTDIRIAIAAENRFSPAFEALLLALLAGTLLAGGCGVQVMRIYPSTVHVPHPDGAVPPLSLEELEELYTAGPDLDPDNKVRANFLWPTSTMMLLTPEIERRREELLRQSYTRSDVEQRAALDALNRRHERQVVIEGEFMSLGDLFVDVRSYGPEGIYLVDDRGTKFLPLEKSLGFRGHPRGETDPTRSTPLREVHEKSSWWRAFPTLAFPRQAIGPQTRAISLYLSAGYRRVRFTWVFDPTYAAPRPERAPVEYRSGLEQLFRSP